MGKRVECGPRLGGLINRIDKPRVRSVPKHLQNEMAKTLQSTKGHEFENYHDLVAVNRRVR
ncbi:MAG: hypothetical protein ACI9QL_005345 [Candidatus Omnitrophota bacterium]|jgi:hypothetical protein